MMPAVWPGLCLIEDISKIETADTFDRNQWIWDLSAAHWSDADAQSGRIYQKFLPYLV
jgi:hypothetical protein